MLNGKCTEPTYLEYAHGAQLRRRKIQIEASSSRRMTFRRKFDVRGLETDLNRPLGDAHERLLSPVKLSSSFLALPAF